MSHEEEIRSVLSFLQQHHYYKSFITLEQESGLRLQTFGKEMDFLYTLLMKGRFKDAEQFILPLKARSEKHFNAAVCELRKQRFLETIEDVKSPELDELVTLLKEIEQLCTKDEFESLCRCLTLSQVTDNPDFAEWTPWRGRLDCFHKCRSHMNSVCPINTTQAHSPAAHCSVTPSSSPPNECHELHELKSCKKSVTFKLEQAEIISDQESSKNVFIEELEPVPTFEDEEEETEETNPVPSTHELMGQFRPDKLVELAQVLDTQPIRTCCFNAEGDYIALGTNSRSLKICSMHNFVDGLLYNEHQGRSQSIDIVLELAKWHHGSIYCLDWARSGNWLATGSNDKSIKVTRCPDMLTLQENNSETVIYSDGQFYNLESEEPAIEQTILRGHTGTVRTLCFHPYEDAVLASAGIGDFDLKVWNTETQKCVQSMTGHTGAIYSVTAAGDGASLISAGSDKTIKVWDLRTYKPVQSYSAESFGAINSVAVNFAAKHVQAEAKLKIAQLYSRSAEPEPTQAPLIAAGHTGGAVSVWNVVAGKQETSFLFHNAECRSVDFSSNGRWLLSGSFDTSLGVIDLRESEVYQIHQHTDRVVCAKWHPTLPIVLSTSTDKTAKVFAI